MSDEEIRVQSDMDSGGAGSHVGSGEPTVLNMDEIVAQTVRCIMAYQNVERRQTEATPAPQASVTRPIIGYKELSEIIPTFSGNSGEIDVITWINRIESVKAAYDVDDKLLHLLAVGKMVGIAKEWYHSKVENVNLPWDHLKGELRNNFSYQQERVQVQKKFEARRWKKGENFNVYYHDKVKLGNRLNLSDVDMIGYIIDGLDHRALQSQARMRCFTSLTEFLQVMNSVTQTDYGGMDHGQRPNQGMKSTTTVAGKGKTSKPEETIKCFNCGMTGHKVAQCKKPKREKGSCFKCGQMDHKANDCKQQKKTEGQQAVPDSTTNVLEDKKISHQNYTINFVLSLTDDSNCECNYSMNALLDTGSPINLIKSKYVPLNCLEPNLYKNDYTGLNASPLTIIGVLNTTIVVQNTNINVKFYVVPEETMSFPSILGRDFIENSSLNFTFGKKLIVYDGNLNTESNSNCVVDEIMHINYDEHQSEKEVVRIGDQVCHPLKMEIENLCINYKRDVESNTSIEHDYFMKIRLKHEQPITFSPRRISFADKQKLQEILDELV